MSVLNPVITGKLTADSDLRGELYFFFYCYGHHRDLHSFPTRRSSDLAAGEAGGILDTILKRLATYIEKAVKTLENRDRKSTRLNSSHGYISYAVFCLKKKSDLVAHPRAILGMG